MGPQYFWMSGMWIFPIIGITCMIIVMYFIFGRGNNTMCNNSGHNTNSKNEETALEILKKRYAKGEITKEEFETIKKEIL
jgi:putative membrane protein